MGIDVVSTVMGSDQELGLALTAAGQILSGFGVAVPRQIDQFAYFNLLDKVLMILAESGGIEPVEAVMTHVGYIAGKAGCHATVILGGGHFATHRQIILDALANIGPVLQAALRIRPVPPPEGFPEDVFTLILEAEAQLAGWCSREKALAIARTVLQERPKTCVEIGVFGGRSLVPCAAALRHIGAGEVYGIEAWSSGVAIENVTNAVNDDWWSKVDFARIKQEFYRFVAETDLTRHVRVIEAPSARAAVLFDQIDFLHLDGAHSMINAAEDVILYARKVRSGGIVVFDDVNWQSTAPAIELLGTLCETVTTLKDPDSGLDICAVMRRR